MSFVKYVFVLLFSLSVAAYAQDSGGDAGPGDGDPGASDPSNSADAGPAPAAPTSVSDSDIAAATAVAAAVQGDINNLAETAIGFFSNLSEMDQTIIAVDPVTAIQSMVNHGMISIDTPGVPAVGLAVQGLVNSLEAAMLAQDITPETMAAVLSSFQNQVPVDTLFESGMFNTPEPVTGGALNNLIQIIPQVHPVVAAISIVPKKLLVPKYHVPAPRRCGHYTCLEP